MGGDWAIRGGGYDRGIVTAVTARVPAKVNLQLSVGPPGADGYHDLVTVFHALALFDEVTVTPADTDSVVVTGEGAGSVPQGPGNLAARAAAALVDAVGPGVRDAPGLAIEIRKRIPVAAGLAGGSADAAAALVACDALWGTGRSRDELATVASTLGSDIPFLLGGGTALGTGRGERVSPVLAGPHAWHWVVAIADDGLSTPEVYRELDRLRAASSTLDAGPPDRLLAALRQRDPGVLAAALANDLQPAALSLRPALRHTLSAGAEEGALTGIVSGSGPTCVFLAEDTHHATELAARLAEREVCHAVFTAHGPVPGARVT